MRFRHQYYFLSNMFPCRILIPINHKMYTFQSAEAAYQATKCPSRAGEFTTLDGRDAKRHGRMVILRKDWNDSRVRLMQMIVTAKFLQNPELINQLLNVDGHIQEDNTWGDTFWGVDEKTGHGENYLGRILMELRDQFRLIGGEMI